MTGSEHFQIYDHNLRRILLLDWLHDEQIRRHALAQGAESRTNQRTREPYWVMSARDIEGGRIAKRQRQL